MKRHALPSLAFRFFRPGWRVAALGLLLLLGLACAQPASRGIQEFAGPLRPGLNQVEIMHDGLPRGFDVRLPVSFREGRTCPLVLWFHGLGGHKEDGHYTLDPLMEREGFIAVYPQGIGNSWNAGIALTSDADDTGFTLALLDWICARAAVDPARIYAMGYSNGGHFSHLLAQRTARFAAVASIASSLFSGPRSALGPRSVMQVHGDQDEMVPYGGGWSPPLGVSFESAPSTAAWWAQVAGLPGEPTVEQPEECMTTYLYRDPGQPHEVALVRLHGTGHNPTTHPYFASLRCIDAIWAFFQRHPGRA